MQCPDSVGCTINYGLFCITFNENDYVSEEGE